MHGSRLRKIENTANPMRSYLSVMVRWRQQYKTTQILHTCSGKGSFSYGDGRSYEGKGRLLESLGTKRLFNMQTGASCAALAQATSSRMSSTAGL